MIKKRERSLELDQLQALYRRMHKDNTKRENVYSDLIRKKTEIKGLNAIDFPLQFIKNEAIILHDIRLQDKFGHFQMDVILLNPKCIVILEVKNWYGTILFKEIDQVIRINDNGEQEGFPNPITQAKLQQYRLRKWLHKHGYTNILVQYLVVISFPHTIVQVDPNFKGSMEKVIHSNQLVFKWNNRMNTLPPNGCSQNVKDLTQLLIHSHTPPDNNMMEKYHVHNGELVKGMFCFKCELPTMVKKYNKWVCQKCRDESFSAHLENINDYKLLLGHIASNKQLRNFLAVDCIHVMKRMIKNAGYEPIGTGRMRKYLL